MEPLRKRLSTLKESTRNLLFALIFINFLLISIIIVMPSIVRDSLAKSSSPSSTSSAPTTSNTSGIVIPVAPIVKKVKEPSVKISFVNSYWTDNTAVETVVAGSSSTRVSASPIAPVVKQEVGPGEGPSTLAIVLINRGAANITGVTGSLDLPSGFKPLIDPKKSHVPGAHSDTALGSYDGVIRAGETFTLYFAINVLDNANLGKHSADLKIGYFKLNGQNGNSQSKTITVPFTLPGKVVLDAASRFSASSSNFSSVQTLNLTPDVPNMVRLTIRNHGSATANGVIATISGVTSSANADNNINIVTGNSSSGLVQQPSSSSSTVNLGTKTFNIGTVSAGQTATISPVIYPSISAAGTVQILDLSISYNDAYGNKKTSSQLIGLQILPSSPQPGLSITPIPSASQTYTSPFHSYPLSLFQSSLSYSPSSSSTITRSIAFSSPPLEGLTRSNGSIDTSAQLPQRPSSSSSSNSSNPLIQIKAGKVQDLKFMINNNNIASINSAVSIPDSINDLAVSLSSQSNSVRIVGPSSWNLNSIKPQSQQELSTQVFASTSLIGSPIFFTVNIQYIQFGHQLKTASFNLGAIVVGDIKISVNDPNIRYIGNTPYLVGNILNQGNTPALFSSIEMVKQNQAALQQRQQKSLMSSSPSPSSSTIKNSTITFLSPLSSQYLGSLAVNSPVSFKIPLKILQLPATISTEQKNASNSSLTQNTTVNAQRTNRTFSNIIDTKNDTTSGTYPVSLKITYSDDLKNTHELIENKSISFDFQPIVQTGEKGQVGNRSGQQQIQQQSNLTNGFIDAYWAANMATSTGTNDFTSNGNSSAILSSTLPVPPQQEVGPGEGKSVLAVVLSNTGFSDINGIIGYLTVPPGFSAATGTSIASLDNVVKAGQTYTLFFKLNILKTATIGTHSASLRINYFEVPELEPGKYSSDTFMIPFTLPGRVILDTVPRTTDLNPGISNTPKIEIKNKGTADAHSVIITITGMSGNSITGTNSGIINNSPTITGNGSSDINPTGQTSNFSPTSSIATVNLGARTFNIGTIPVNGTAEISPIIYPSDSAGGTLQNLNLQISYSNANGDKVSSDVSVGFRVLPIPPDTGLSLTPSSNPSNVTPNTNSTNGQARNNNSAGLSLTPSSTSNIDHSSNRNVAFLQFSHAAVPLNYNKNNNDAPLALIAYRTEEDDNVAFLPSTTPALHLDRIVTTTNHNNNNNMNNDNNDVNETSLVLVAGKTEDMSFSIANNNNFPITHAVITLASQNSDLKIVGDSIWSLQIMNPHSKYGFSTKIYASTSLIGNPVSFLVTVQYISGGQSKMSSFNLGGNVVGDIKVSVNDLDISSVAGTPNLVGNILNQGNTVGLFTTVQMINQPFSSSQTGLKSASSGINQSSNGNSMTSTPSQRHNEQLNASATGKLTSRSSTFNSHNLIPVTPPQYLGDLQPDSPLPFSIPLNIDNGISPGSYPVSLKITYSDDLKNTHELILNKNLNVKPQHRQQRANDQGLTLFGIVGNSSSRGAEDSRIFGIPLLVIIIIAIIGAVAIALILIIRRRRSRAASLGMSENDQLVTEDDDNEDIESLIDDYQHSDDKKKHGTNSIGGERHGP
jgi:hypothetical protein